ncbi:MAG: hypothetical protein ACRDRQ_10645 [Pseudonocardiaceae bacterium]
MRAGEPRGLTLANHGIEAVSTLQSAAVRRERLIPLAAALEARPGTDTQELARTARQIATTRSKAFAPPRRSAPDGVADQGGVKAVW